MAKSDPFAMKSTTWIKLATIVTALAGVGLFAATVVASDHHDAPSTINDAAADLSDLYVWHTDQNVYAVITFAGRRAPAPGQSGTYDAEVLYTLEIDADRDTYVDKRVLIQFGQNQLGEWGVSVVAPGVGQITGPVEEVLTSDTLRVFAGLRDDPFFFDLQGHAESLATSSLRFDSTRDSFAGTNATAIVLEIDRRAFGSDSRPAIWAQASRPWSP